MISQSAEEKLQVFSVCPFELCDPGDFPESAPPNPEIHLRGFRNDWLIAGVGLRSPQDAALAASFEGDAELSGTLEMRIAGEVRHSTHGRKTDWRFDPLFKNPASLGDLSADVRNWETIQDFPRQLALRAGQPALIVLTVKTHTLGPGTKRGAIVLSIAAPRNTPPVRIPIQVEIHPQELPEDNPILGHTWSTFKEDEELARLARDYGINACGYYDNWDMLRRVGFRFFRFSFPISQPNGRSLECEDSEILENLKPIQDAVQRLQLRPEEWAIDIYDEPSDGVAWAYAAWMIRIRRLWKDARFYANPGYDPGEGAICTPENMIQPLSNLVDVWCPYEAYLRMPEFMRAIKQTGRSSWFYTVEFSQIKPRRGGRQTPWLAWRLKLDGWAFYSLREYGKANPWRDNVCSRMYPGHTMSLWMEGLRQGVQDYKRLWVLEKSSGMAYDDITSNVLHCVPWKDDPPWGGAEPQTYNKVRERLDDLILKQPIPQRR